MQIYSKQIEKILNSKEFESCKTEKKLLLYLFKNTFNKEPLNETTIANEVFSKNSYFNPAEDSIVRVHTHNLRKKLYTYYLSEGKDDEIKIEIPKGGYNLKFITNNVKKKSGSFFFNIKKLKYILIIIPSILLLLQWIYYNYTNPRHSRELSYIHKSPIWNNSITNDQPVLFVVGDQFFFIESNNNPNNIHELVGMKIMRFSRINSIDDLNNYSTMIEADTSLVSFKPYKPAIIEKEILWSFRSLYPILDFYNDNFEMKLASELNGSDLQNYNIIFIGITKTLGILNPLLSKLHIQYKVFPHQLIVNHSPDSVQTFSPKGIQGSGPRKDYVMVSKLPGPNKKNSIMIITCTDLAGVYEAVNALTEKESLKQLEAQLREKHGVIPEYYELALEVNTISRIGFSTKLIASFPISPNIDLVKLHD